MLTIRNAILNARQLATVDRYSNGRLLLGIGVGWLKEEADAMGMPWDRRGARTDEHIALLRAIWTAPGKHVEFHGEFWDIPPMDPEPRPVQRPIPILIGGHSEAASTAPCASVTAGSPRTCRRRDSPRCSRRCTRPQPATIEIPPRS